MFILFLANIRQKRTFVKFDELYKELRKQGFNDEEINKYIIYYENERRNNRQHHREN